MNFDYIYIYQFGKVGSTSLFNYLKKNHKNVIFCHHFNDTYQKGYVGDNTKLKKTGWLIKNQIKYKNFV